MKKIILYILTASMLLSVLLFSGCDVNPTGSPDIDPTPTPTPLETPVPQRAFDVADFVSNYNIWKTPEIRDEGFLFEIQCGGENVVKDGLGDPHEIFSSWGPERWSKAEEWGNFILNCDGIEFFDGTILETHFGGDEAPKTREEAVQKIFDYLNRTHKPLNVSGTLYAMNSICPWQHYAAECGFDVLGAEFAESYNYQLRLAMTRGAARQYGTPWYIDFSSWYGGMLDYRENQPYGQNPDGTNIGGPNNGHSINLQERSFIMSYMAGADAMVAEGGGPLCYYEKEKEYIVNVLGGYTVVYEGKNITPYGELCKKFYQFSKDYSDVGSSYTPYALILDYYHGMEGYNSLSEKAFGRLYYEDGDIFTQEIIAKIWPTWDKIKHCEKKNLVNTKYGESFDMLLQNASADVCSTYKALILTGNLELSEDEVKKYTDYVKNGGCIVANTAYVDLFDEIDLPHEVEFGKTYTEVQYGKGSFIIFGNGGAFEACINEDGSTTLLLGADYSAAGFDSVMELLQERYMPFELSADVDYLINVKDNTLYLTLINNDGITKYGYEAVQIDESAAVELDIRFTDNYNYKIISVSDIYNSIPVELNSGTVSLTLPAGGIAVLEFELE